MNEERKNFMIEHIKNGRMIKSVPKETIIELIKEVAKPEDKPKNLSKMLKEELVEFCSRVFTQDHYITEFTKAIFKKGADGKMCKKGCKCHNNLALVINEILTDVPDSERILIQIERKDYDMMFNIISKGKNDIEGLKDMFRSSWDVVKLYTPPQLENEPQEIKDGWYFALITFFITRKFIFGKEIPLLEMAEVTKHQSIINYNTLNESNSL